MNKTSFRSRSNKVKIVTIIGARPQFVKIPLVSTEIRKFAKEIIIHTGQHYDVNMSDVFFHELKIPKPNYHLGVGSSSQGKQTGQMLEKIEEILLKEKPDLVIIYGDTNSTIAGALAAAKLHIPVAHVEAGMRSYNREMPEEINRVVSDHISDLLFCPTRSSAKILKGEGVTKGVYWVGDVMCDIQLKIRNPKPEIRKTMNKYNIEPKKYLLATVHRQENTDVRENLENIITAFTKIKETIIFPVHPRTKKYIKLYKLDSVIDKSAHIHLIEPIGYKDMITLESNAKMVLTDSGGVQKEAYLAHVPCITLRNETEWIETAQAGWNKLVGTDVKKIVKFTQNFPSASWKRKTHPNFLGDGKAYMKIAKIIKHFLGTRRV